MTDSKHCTGCGADKPRGDFHRRSKSPDGVSTRCKDCAKATAAARYADPKRRAAMRVTQYAWVARNSDQLNAKRRKPQAPRVAAPDGCKFCSRCGDAVAISEFGVQRASRDGRHPWCKQCVVAYGRERYINNADAIKAQVYEKRRANPALARVWQYAGTMRYWARRRGAVITGVRVGITEIKSRWAMWGGRCYLCGDGATATDHVIPLSAGGLHVPANLRPICHTCNSKKGAKSWRQFVAA